MLKHVGEKLPDPKERKQCKHKRCIKFALFLEDFCWEHLSAKAKAMYRHKIEEWLNEELSLEGACLSKADLSGADVPEGDFRSAHLDGANLSGANLGGSSFARAFLEKANLQGAFLEVGDFREAYLFKASLKGANLLRGHLQHADLSEADLSGANLMYAEFQGSNLSYSNFRGADCTRANFSAADLTDAKFEFSELGGVVWGDARYLRWENVKMVANEKNRRWSAAWSAYLRLKNYFHQQGKYEDERKAYYREKVMSEREALWDWLKGYQPPLKGLSKLPLMKRIKPFSRWLGLWLFHITTGFGERVGFTVLWALGVIAFFGFLYWGGGAAGWFKFAFKPEMIPSIFQYFYLSVVTFATLGFGDITPLNWQAQIPVIFEVIMGYVFLGLIITIIARRFGR